MDKPKSARRSPLTAAPDPAPDAQVWPMLGRIVCVARILETAEQYAAELATSPMKGEDDSLPTPFGKEIRKVPSA